MHYRKSSYSFYIQQPHQWNVTAAAQNAKKKFMTARLQTMIQYKVQLSTESENSRGETKLLFCKSQVSLNSFHSSLELSPKSKHAKVRVESRDIEPSLKSKL